jgi:(p)ppGpp synthase/HD superfamily hydrolase
MAPVHRAPREVAILLDAIDAPDSLVAAGLLHDTVGRTATGPSDLTRCFGDEGVHPCSRGRSDTARIELDGEPLMGSINGMYGIDALPIRWK